MELKGGSLRLVEGFRFEQLRPLNRGTEVPDHPWSLLILREIWIGPQRFSDREAPAARSRYQRCRGSST